MPLLKLAQMGHPILRSAAAAVSEERLADPAFADLVESMVETMRDAGGVGIAAPQVHAAERVVAIEVRDATRYDEAEIHPLTVVVNPRITPLTDEMGDGWEGCLSIAGIRGLVPRFTAVKVEGLDPKGRDIDLELRGFPAVVAQHEVDHLDGILFPDRMRDLRTLTFEAEYGRFHSSETSLAAPPTDEEPIPR